MRILICGDRNWTLFTPIYRELAPLPKDTVIIHGAARGADKMAGEAAMLLGFNEILRFPADWRRYGRRAGPIRNQQMLDEGSPDKVWAFHSNLDISKGTKDMIERARKAGIPVIVFKN